MRGLDLRGAVAVVTGASAGIGRATAWRLAAGGAAVVVAARRAERLEDLAAQIEGRGGRALAVATDVTDRGAFETLHARTIEAFGRCDVLVNDAGVAGGPFERLTAGDIDRIVATNLLGVLHGTHVFLPAMTEAGRGHVVNVASLAGRFALPGSAVYSATKHAVVAFSESLDMTARLRGVRVTALNPAFVPTEGFGHDGRRPSILTLTPQRVAEAVARVVRDGIAPAYSIPRWVAPLEALRVLAPAPYHRGVAAAVRPYLRRSGGAPARPTDP